MADHERSPHSFDSKTHANKHFRVKWYAHSEGQCGKKQLLSQHLKRVAELASEFAEPLGSNSRKEACAAGIAHDLGKYSESFQNRLLSNKLPEGVCALDHSSPGAAFLWQKYGKTALIPMWITHGHHIGLQSIRELSEELGNPVKTGEVIWSETDIEMLTNRAAEELLSLPESLIPSMLLGSSIYSASSILMLRMIYSCVVDADYLDTEAHFHGRRPPGVSLQPARAIERLEKYIHELKSGSESSSQVNTVREELRQSCLKASELKTGTFTLTAPTGSGKTLAMLAFALRHAEQHGLERIIFVLPYLSIIDQTATILQDLFTHVFGTDYILEHHSGTVNLEDTGTDTKRSGHVIDDKLEIRRKQLAENWDAPIIVTTSVQCLESLFSNRPGACRKLHNMSNAVLLFDEVQTLPPHLVVPTLGTLSTLAQKCHSTVLFSTATQPAFKHLGSLLEEHGEPGWKPIEIVHSQNRLFSSMKRVHVSWSQAERIWNWEELADQISEYPEKQTLVIVNIRRHAHTLYNLLKDRINSEFIFHLSTTLCAGHRKVVLSKVRNRLKEKKPCILVSTQCVEAGVDLSFPVVYRAFGPLDSIAQAAGRCNRHGEIERGEVHVFLPEEERYPGGAYKDAAAITKQLLVKHNGQVDLDNPVTYSEYYMDLYDATGAAKPSESLAKAHKGLHLPDIARAYRLIKYENVQVLVAWKPNEFRLLKDEVFNDGLSRDWIRRAQHHAVSIPKSKANDKLQGSLLQVPVYRSKKTKNQETALNWFVSAFETDYKENLGWVPEVQQDIIV